MYHVNILFQHQSSKAAPVLYSVVLHSFSLGFLKNIFIISVLIIQYFYHYKWIVFRNDWKTTNICYTFKVFIFVRITLRNEAI